MRLYNIKWQKGNQEGFHYSHSNGCKGHFKRYFTNWYNDTVPDKALIQYNLQDEQDISYKELVQDKIIFIRKNASRIIKTAKLLYSKKTKSTHKNPVIDKVLDFKSIEEYSIKWQ